MIFDQKKSTKIAVRNFPKPSINKIHDSLQTIYKEVKKTDLYKDDGGVKSDINQTIHILNQVYNYIYNKQESNLKKEDVRIFVDHLMNKMKNIKNLVERII